MLEIDRQTLLNNITFRDEKINDLNRRIAVVDAIAKDIFLNHECDEDARLKLRAAVSVISGKISV